MLSMIITSQLSCFDASIICFGRDIISLEVIEKFPNTQLMHLLCLILISVAHMEKKAVCCKHVIFLGVILIYKTNVGCNLQNGSLLVVTVHLAKVSENDAYPIKMRFNFCIMNNEEYYIYRHYISPKYQNCTSLFEREVWWWISN